MYFKFFRRVWYLRCVSVYVPFQYVVSVLLILFVFTFSILVNSNEKKSDCVWYFSLTTFYLAHSKKKMRKKRQTNKNKCIIPKKWHNLAREKKYNENKNYMNSNEKTNNNKKINVNKWTNHQRTEENWMVFFSTIHNSNLVPGYIQLATVNKFTYCGIWYFNIIFKPSERALTLLSSTLIFFHQTASVFVFCSFFHYVFLMGVRSAKERREIHMKSERSE